MNRLRHVDVTLTLTSSGVVIRGFPNGGLSFYVLADDKSFVHYIQNYVACQQYVYQLQEVQT